MPYLDNNATTQPSPAVGAAVMRALAELWHNPSSIHRSGQAARQAVELARASCARLINAKPREITFTSGGTEALDLAIRGVLAARRPGSAATLVTSKVEHTAIRDLAEELERGKHASVKWLPLTDDGRIDPAQLDVIDTSTTLVAVQWANNETGAIQPIARVARKCKACNVPLLVDATQWVGKIPTDVTRLRDADGDVADPFDFLVASAHKFHGPKGVGLLWARPGVRMRPQLLGSQELGRRGGTENVPGIVGAGIAADEAVTFLADEAARKRITDLRDAFERDILGAIPDARVNGPTTAETRLWNTTNIAFPRLEAEALLLLLSERDVAASAGAACSSGSLDPSPVLLAFGVPDELAHGSVRFSLSKHTTPDEVATATREVIDAVKQLRRSWNAIG
ncbi:MAG: cysteine desulfurase family protein [Phycisphaerae bacterium]